MTSERVTATMINRASNGVWNGGRIPYGYSYDKPTQIFSIDPEENKVYNFLVETYEDTQSIVHTSRKLNEAGYRSRNGNMWSPVAVWTILRNPWYKGVYRYNYYKIPGRKAIKDESEKTTTRLPLIRIGSIGSRLLLIKTPGIGILREERQLRRTCMYFLDLSGVQSADPLSLLLQASSTSPDIVRQNMDARMSGKRKLAMRNILRMLFWANSF